MRKIFSAATLSPKAKKTVDISRFLGISDASFCDGGLRHAKNITVTSEGALVSLLAEKKLDTSAATSLSDGVYTLCEDFDSEYETAVSADWIYKNVFPERVRSYGEGDCSRVLIKGIGMPPKTEKGYRCVKGSFLDGDRLFIFYEARYNLIDNPREGIFEAVGSALSWRFFSSEEKDTKSDVKIYTLTQLWLDVIEGDRVESSLVDARLDLIRRLNQNKYKWSRLISEDKVNYKYTTPEYVPPVGESYTAYYDRVYTELYQTLGEESSYLEASEERCVIKYNNLTDGGNAFSQSGEKLLVFPEKRLLFYSGGRWQMSSESADAMEKLSGCVQLYDRLYGIRGDKLFVSRKGDCTDFNTDVEPDEGAPWRMVASNGGDFTAICAFSGRVAVFTKNSMLSVRGSELPFTLSHEADLGCRSQNALATLFGKLYFVSESGIFCTGGGAPVCISGALPTETDYSMVMLSAANGLLVAALGSFDELWIYNPASSAWSKLSLGGCVKSLSRDFVIAEADGGTEVYKLFAKDGAFEFSVGIENRGAHRLKGVWLTASVSQNGEVCLIRDSGEELLSIYAPQKSPSTKHCSIRMHYFDHAELRFCGYGAVTVYKIRCEI